MILCIDALLSPDDFAGIAAKLPTLTFRDGRETAGREARLVKSNLQAAPASGAAQAVKVLIGQRLADNALFKLAARPKKISPLILNRYDEGMGYGAHVDDALMGGLRTDVSFTLFLSPPESYDGGELVIDSTGGEERFKLKAGALVLYPSSTLHRVETVTRGTRFAAVGWVESYVRDAAKRALLFDLDTARHALFRAQGKTDIGDLLSKSVSNLLRLWAET